MYLGKLVQKAHSLTAIADFYVNSRSDTVGKTPEEIIEFSYRHYPTRPRQVRSELLALARLVRRYNPKTLVEIGTHAGGTFFVLCRCADPHATVISIDLPGAQFSGGQPKFIDSLLPRMPLETQSFHALRSDSHHPGSSAWLAKLLQGREVDVMLIDGDHTYDGVKKDFDMYSPFVRKGGIVAFHDVVKHTNDPDCEVDKFWEEVKTRYKHQELIEDPAQGWAGVGVLYV
jgi:predicted O-methyltransferase YrrM